MTVKPLPIGYDNFHEIIVRGCYYIDKTLLIKELLDKYGKVNLFTRPRRFGKSLNMSMLRYYFEDTRDDNGAKKDNSFLFENLKISRAGEKYTKHMGEYPVIMLTLKSAKQPSFEMAYHMLTDSIAEEFDRHKYILDGSSLMEHEQLKYKKIMLREADKAEYANALQFLSNCLYKYHNKKVIILIDEYDVPLENSFMRGFYDEMIDFIRSLFESALKTNESLEFAVITGCLRISKESIFTGLNNLKVYSILEKNYAEYFGFTEEDVKKICEDYNMPSKYDMFKKWYNGYIFGNTNVYNPWSVILYMSDLLADENEYPHAYWANTSSNSIVRKLIERSDSDTREEIEKLIAGGTIRKPVHEDITYDEIYKTMDNLWNFMYFTGYFRKESEEIDTFTNQRYVNLTIPNEEVRYIFRTKVLGWFDEQVKEKDRSRLFKAFLESDAEVLEEEIQQILMETISFYDACESFYHGFLTGILSGINGYIVKSNREGGRGRTDLFVKPVTRRKRAFVVEFKVADDYDELEDKAHEALEQIERNDYAKELWSDGYRDIARYGVSFFRKDCCVKAEEM